MSTVVASSKLQAEELNVSVDFLSRCAIGETCVTVATGIEVLSGVDANPSAMLSGSPGVSGTIATQKLINGLPGVIYLLTFAVRSSLNAVYLNQVKIAVLSSPDLNP